MKRYKIPICMSVLGIGCLASPQLLKLPSQVELDISTDLTRQRVEARKENSEAFKKAGVEPETKTLTVQGYIDTPKRPPGISKEYLQARLPGEIRVVYDSAGTCVGEIRDKKFFWKKHFKGVCE